MAEVTFYYGAQVKNERLPVSVQLKSFLIQYQTTIGGLLPSVQSPKVQSFTVTYDVQTPSFEYVTPKLQEFTLSAEGAYYVRKVESILNVERICKYQHNSEYILWNTSTQPIHVENNSVKSTMNYIEHIVSTGVPVVLTSNYNNSVIWRVIDTMPVVHNLWRKYTSYNIVDTLVEQTCVNEYLHMLISGKALAPQIVALQQVIFNDYNMGIHENVSTISVKGTHIPMSTVTGSWYSSKYAGNTIRVEIHHPYRLSAEYILRNVDYRQHINTMYFLGKSTSTQYTVATNLFETYIKVYSSVGIPVDEVSIYVYTQYAIANVYSGQTTVTLDYPEMFGIGDIVIITDGSVFYERTVTEVNTDSIILDSAIPSSVYDGRIYKKVEMEEAYIPYTIYTRKATQYMLLMSSYDCTVAVSSPVDTFDTTISMNTYKEITFTIPLKDIMLPESTLNLVTVEFGKLVKTCKVYFVKLTAEPLVRSMDANAVERAVLWFDNCLSMEMESIMANLRYEMYTGVSNALNRYVYYMPLPHTNLITSAELPFELVEIEDISVYKVITLTGDVWKTNRSYTAIRGALLYVNRYIYYVEAEQVLTFDDMVSSISRAPDKPHIFEYTAESDAIPVYAYIPPAFEGSLYRVDILEYYIFDETTGGGSGGVIFG